MADIFLVVFVVLRAFVRYVEALVVAYVLLLLNIPAMLLVAHLLLLLMAQQ